MGKEIGKRWKSLDPETKAKYDLASKADQDRYRAQKIASKKRRSAEQKQAGKQEEGVEEGQISWPESKRRATDSHFSNPTTVEAQASHEKELSLSSHKHSPLADTKPAEDFSHDSPGGSVSAARPAWCTECGGFRRSNNTGIHTRAIVVST